MPENSPDDVTRLLRAAGEGDSQAAGELLPLVYEQLRGLAASRLKRLPPGQTLQPTALVHEAYLRLVGSEDPGWESREQFFFAAARAMHNILVDSARRKASLKRGGDRKRVDGSNLASAIEAPAEDMLALSDALESLERTEPRQYRLVMLRFFAGLSTAQAAELLGVTERTAKRDWRAARLALHAQIGATTAFDE